MVAADAAELLHGRPDPRGSAATRAGRRQQGRLGQRSPHPFAAWGRIKGMSQPDTMFASRSVPRHLVRGALGLPMMVAAFVLVPWLGPLALLLVVPAAVLLRGCPTCWALGLAQTCALSPRASTGGSRRRR